MFGGTFAPEGWMFCAGQLLPISEYETLFNLIGTTYGGDGSQTFALPDLQGRLPMHNGAGFNIGQTLGSETVTLTTLQIPAHSHPFLGSAVPANTPNPENNVVAQPSQVNMFFAETNPTVAFATGVFNNTGGNQPHYNMMPYLCVTFIISLFGIYPSPT